MKSVRRVPDIYTSRRQFLSLCSSAAVTLPYASMLMRSAHAQSATGPHTRFIAMFSPHGCVHELWRPRAANGGLATNLDFSFAFENAHLGPLQDYRAQLAIVDGVDFRANYEAGGYGGHEVGISTCLTGGTASGSHESIDQYIARRLDHRPVRSIELGVGTQSQAGPDAWDLITMSWDQRGHGVQNIVDPALAWDKLFSDISAPPDNAQDRARQTRRRLAALDFSATQARALEQALTGTEREKLQAHLTSLDSLRRSLGFDSAPGDCASPAQPAFANATAPSSHDAVIDTQIDLIAAAFACDAARVASLQVHYAGQSTTAPYMLAYTGFGEGQFHFDLHNNVAHAAGNSEADDQRVAEVGQYHARKLARLLAALDVPDPLQDGTILDNTVIYWTNELGNPAAHHNVGVPTILAGGGSGRLRRGQYIQVRPGLPSWNQFDALYPHNRVLTTICHAMGFDDVAYYGNDHFRTAAPYQGPIDGALT